jgi:RimJ/RimL family protein N-acetyltransferase
MKLFKYGIVLKRITKDDIELVRRCRNSEGIHQFMHYRGHITKKMQKRWFKSIDNIYNFFYLVYYCGEPIGMFNEKNINWEEHSSETGLIIWDERYIDTQVPLMISLLLSEVGFYIFHGEKAIIRILQDNKKAIQYALSFGYRLCEGEQDKELQKYELTKERFEQIGVRLLKAMNSLYKSSNTLYLLLEPNDYKIGIAQHLEKIISNELINAKRKEDDQGVWYCYP